MFDKANVALRTSVANGVSRGECVTFYINFNFLTYIRLESTLDKGLWVIA